MLMLYRKAQEVIEHWIHKGNDALLVQGARQTGKTFLIRNILSSWGDYVEFNFIESPQLVTLFKTASSAEDLLRRFSAASGRPLNAGKTIIFLDEVQLVKDWNIACRSLRLENLSLFITGSNSKLLSKEFTKELSGRYVSFGVRPFVYKEIAEYATQLGKSYPISDYLVYGGFPKVIELPDKESVTQYLNDLNQTIIINDIMNRYRIKKTELFKRLVNYVLISNSRIFSANSVQHYLASEKLNCSINTVMKYLSYLEEAYVIRKVPQYSTRAKRELAFFAKIYDEDVSFNTIRQHKGRFDITHNLENVIYNELIYMGYDVSVFTKGTQEIDFLAVDGGKEYLIQVAYSIAEDSTYNREFALFNTLDQSRKKIIITNDEINYSTSTVEHISLSRFLSMTSLDG